MQKNILFLFLFLLVLVGKSQNNLLDKKLSVELSDATIQEILENITRETGIYFSYNSRNISSPKTLTINIVDQTIDVVLKRLADEFNIEYRVVREQIVIKKIPPSSQTPHYTISGVIYDKTTGESLPGATILIKDLNKGAFSNSYGFFSLSLPQDTYTLSFSFIGYNTDSLVLELNTNQQINPELEPNFQTLGEVIVMVTENPEHINKSQTGKLTINPRQFEQMPQFAGEIGLIKSLQSLPGFQTHSDGSSFFFARGGNKDQNLILIDEAPVFNPAHLFGFYSVIIPEVAKEINIYKADMPIEKAGRLSSVIDIQTREGNIKSYSAEGLLNPLMYRFSVEGPIAKNKASIFASFRRSNLEWIYHRFSPNSDFFIRDINFKVNWQINNKNRVYFSAFNGTDNYTTPQGNGQIVGIGWSNLTSTFRWNRIYNNKLFSNLTFFASEYKYKLLIGGPSWQSGIRNVGLKYDFTYYPDPDITWRMGFSQMAYGFNPGNLTDYNEELDPLIPRVYAGDASETALYVSREKRITEKWAWNAALRTPLWINKGPARVYPLDNTYAVTDTIDYSSKETIASYLNLDFRLSARYRINTNSSLRLSMGLYHQNLHLISNTISPFSSFEIWMPSNYNIKPQKALQISAGYTRFFPQSGLEWVSDAYIKNMTNQIEYADHAPLLLNPLIESQLRFGTTHSYGLEFMLKRTTGILSGWIAYTWSGVANRFPEINENRSYPSFYDRPHEFSLFLTWRISPKTNISTNWIYHSGSAITTPVGFYSFNNSTVPVYDKKNNDRLPNYHRMDISFEWFFGKPSNRYQHSLNLGIYNLYNKQNPISLNFNKTESTPGNYNVQENLVNNQNLITTQKYLSSIMPSLSYKFKIQ